MTGFAGFVEDLELVDHHVHGCFRTDGDEARFAGALSEGDAAAPYEPGDGYDSQLGFALRRWCPELLDLPRHAEPAAYWARRSVLGEAEVNRRLTRAAGVGDWLVDTGFGGDRLLDPPGLAAASGGRAYEVVRLETLAEGLIGALDDPADYADAFRARLADAARSAVGAKSVLAYRGGFDRDLTPPDPAAVRSAARRWRDEIETGAGVRLTDVALITCGIYAALDARLPLQLHVGLGDRDLDLRTVDPLLLTDLLRRPEAARSPILLLHCYPYERQAGYLAHAYEQVHLDVGLGLSFVGARAPSVLAHALELAPFRKVLYSSDAAGPAELHFLGARLWRNAVTAVLGGWVAAGDWSDTDARRVTTLVGRDNARRVYALP